MARQNNSCYIIRIVTTALSKIPWILEMLIRIVPTCRPASCRKIYQPFPARFRPAREIYRDILVPPSLLRTSLEPLSYKQYLTSNILDGYMYIS